MATQPTSKQSPLRPSLIPMVLGAALLLTLLTSLLLYREEQQQALAEFQYRAERQVQQIEARLGNYQQLLLGGVALFDASDEVSQTEWQAYTQYLRITETLPGLQFFGFQRWLKASDRQQYEATTRREIAPDFQLWPAGERETYSIIDRLAPITAINRTVLGYDSLSDPVRRAVILQARDSGILAATPRLKLMVKDSQGQMDGIIVYLPVYQKGMPTGTVSERRAALYGFVFGVFMLHDLMQHLLKDEQPEVRLQIFQRDTQGDNALFDSTHDTPASAASTSGSVARYRTELPLDFGGQHWVVRFQSLPGYTPREGSSVNPWLLLAGGLLVNLLLFVVIRANSRHRRALEASTTELQASQSRFNMLVANMPGTIIRCKVAPGWPLVFMSGDIEISSGYPVAEYYSGQRIHRDLVHPDDLPQIEANIWQALSERRRFFFEFRVHHRDGHWHWANLHGQAVYGDDDTPLFIDAVIIDNTARKDAEQGIRQSEALLQQVFNTTNAAIFLVDNEGILTLANQRMAEMFHCSMAQLIGNPYATLVPPDERIITEQKMRALLISNIDDIDLERQYWREDGSTFWGSLCGRRFRDADGNNRGVLCVIMDITVRHNAEEEIRTLAFYDPLTHLPNRRLLLDRLQQATATNARSGLHGALIFIDLDHFKTLNDTLGHALGDDLLVAVAARLRACVREGDTVARLGGDEFIVMLPELHESAQESEIMVEAVGLKIIHTLNPVHQLGPHELRSTPSLGITLFQGHDASIDELLKRADMAMYQAKAAGRNTLRFFDPAMQARINARVQMEKELHQAIAQQEFQLHYQPQMNASGHCIGVEALLRWRQPQRGMVSPAQFIPLAEESGQILAIGSWVILQACQQQVAWQQHPHTAALEIAINVSARQFRQPTFVEELCQQVQQTGALPARLKLELTESMLLSDVDEAIHKMNALQAFGFTFSLDDFGTGYSSLSYLKKLPLHQMKIDQSFVRDILQDANDRAICRAIIALGKSLGMRVIAEGVETDAQWHILQNEGCDEAQGYLFARPLPITELDAWLTSQRPSRNAV